MLSCMKYNNQFLWHHFLSPITNVSIQVMDGPDIHDLLTEMNK